MIQNMSKPRRASKDFSLLAPLFSGERTGASPAISSVAIRMENSPALLNVTTGLSS